MIAAGNKQEIQAGASNQPQPPAWLELEPGERYLKSYPTMQVLIAALIGILVILGLAGVVMLVAVALGEKEGLSGLLTILGSISGVAISLGQFSGYRLHVTSKMLVFGLPPKGVQGLPLAQITRIGRGRGLAKCTISIYGPRQDKPATVLYVLKADEVLAELTAYINSAEAKRS